RRAGGRRGRSGATERQEGRAPALTGRACRWDDVATEAPVKKHPDAVLVVILMLAACQGRDGESTDLDTSVDMKHPEQRLDLATGPDLGTPEVRIGAPCTQSAECKEGATPICWVKTLLDQMDYLEVPGGYCTSKCTRDLDCGV